MTDYKGLVPRQALVDFCQEQVVRIQTDIENLEKADKYSCDYEQKLEYEKIKQLRRGEQIALRNVCEWAKTVLVKDHRDEGEGVLQRNIV